MNVIHVIRRLTGGGATMGLLRSCLDGPAGVNHAVVSLIPAEDGSKARFESAGVSVVTGPSIARDRIADADLLQIEWWNNPYINDFLTNTELPPTRILLHARGHFDAPLMCPSTALLRRVDACSVTTPSAAANPHFNANRADAGLAEARCIVSVAADPGVRCRDVPTGRMKIGYLGTVEPIKMHAETLRIAAAVVRAEPDVMFEFAGDGLLEVYRREACELGLGNHTRFLGFQPDPASFLSRTDIFFYPLNPFTYATSEKALQEAMLAGLPCIAFPSGGIRDLLSPDCALIVHTPEECVEACVALLSSEALRKKFGDRARARVEQFPARRRWREELYRAWTETAGRPARPRPALYIEPKDLLGFSTDRRACDPTSLEEEGLADFRRVAAFVVDDYRDWLRSRPRSRSRCSPP